MISPDAALPRKVGRRESVVEDVGHKCGQIRRIGETVHLDDLAEPTIDDMPASSTPAQGGAAGTHLLFDDEHQLDLEMGMIEQGRDTDELVEDREDVASLR